MSHSPVDMVIIPRSSDIGGFEVQRALPFRDKRMVGPFIFWDQMGPGEFVTGQGMDVRPHPHIGLSTVTYLFDGAIDHRDSLGSYQRIFAGDVNLMSAGRGIVHSERSGADLRQHPQKIYGIQSWLAQPLTAENGDPSFLHTGKAALPAFQSEGVTGRLMMGEYQGLRSPIPLQWDTLYMELHLEAGATLQLDAQTEERALYALGGELEIAGQCYQPMQMLVLHPQQEVLIKAVTPLHLMVLGGAVMDAPRFIYWNFVSSSKERLEQARQDWKERRFLLVPGDELEFVPLPEGK